MRQRAAIDVFELPSDRHAVSDTARAYSAPGRELAQVMRGGFALDGRVGGEDQLADAPFIENRLELAQSQLLGTDTIERREVPHQYEVAAAVAARGFDGDDVRGRLDGAQEAGLALGRGADHAQLTLGEHAAAAASHHRGERGIERLGQGQRSGPTLLQEVKGHALGGLGADAGETPERLDQLREMRRMLQGDLPAPCRKEAPGMRMSDASFIKKAVSFPAGATVRR